MYQSGGDVSERAYRAFVRTSGLFRNLMRPYFAQFGISGAQWGILRQLHRAENEGIVGLRLAELGKRLLVKPPSVTSLVDRLERMGLLSRTVARSDQRARQVSLTSAGRALVMRVLKRHPAQIREIMAGLGQTERRQLWQIMDKLADHLESLPLLSARTSPVATAEMDT